MSSSPEQVVETAIEGKGIVHHYDVCRDRGHSVTACVASSVLHTIYERTTHLMPVLGAADFVQECAVDHPVIHCVAGAAVKQVTEVKTYETSVTLLSRAPTIPNPVVAGATATAGAMGMVTAPHIGHQAGDLTVKVLDYLVDHVPADCIDDSAPLTLSDGELTLTFEPHEVALMKSLVQQNQDIQVLVQSGREQEDFLTRQWDDYRTRFEANRGVFDEISRRVTMNAADLSDICTQLKTDRLHVVEQTLLDRMHEPVHNDLVECFQQVEAHNARQVHTSAHVEYKGRNNWRVGFQVRVGFNPDGSRCGGGGFFCVLL